MSDSVKIEVTRVPDIPEIKARVYKALLAQMRDNADLVTDYASGLAPVDTGRLKGSITSQVTARTGRIDAVVGTNLEYAPYVEFGTGRAGDESGGASYAGHDSDVTYAENWHGQKAQPYLRPAIYDNEDVLFECLKRAVDEAIR